MSETENRNVRRTMTGVVVSAKAQNTITVEVERTYKHPRYGKYVRRRKRYLADDAEETANKGDIVELAATRPLSKRKRWRLVRVMSRSALGDAAAPIQVSQELADVTGAAELAGSAEVTGGEE